jgi:RNA-binding protein YlmH
MPLSKRAQTIMQRVRPARKAHQILNVWDDIVALRGIRLTYSQIADELAKEYEIEVSAKRLQAICSAIRRRSRSGKEPQPQAGLVTLPSRENASVLEEMNENIRAAKMQGKFKFGVERSEQ